MITFVSLTYAFNRNKIQKRKQMRPSTKQCVVNYYYECPFFFDCIADEIDPWAVNMARKNIDIHQMRSMVRSL